VVPVIPFVPVLLVSVAIGSAATILAWRERPEPGATPLSVMLLGQSWWSTCIVFKLQADGMTAKVLWTDLAWLGVMAIPVAWLLFALEYTGRDEYVRPRYVALLSVVPALTVLLALTGGFHDLLYVQSVGVGPEGVVRIRQGGPWYWVAAGYTYLLGVAGVVLLLDLLTSDAMAFRGQSAALLVGLLAPWVTNVLYLAGLMPTSGLDPTPVAFSVSGMAYLGALTRFRLLGTSPAPTRRARQFLFDGMEDAAVVIDTNDYVVDANDNCFDLLGADPRTVLGAPAAEVLPEYERFPEHGTLTDYLTVGEDGRGCSYDVTVTRLTNVRGEVIGRAITFHDVSKFLRQQQRLEVLNRVLRHNIRTETNIIHGYADEDTDLVKERALRIEEIGGKARDAIRLFDESRGDHTARSVTRLVRGRLDSLREAHPEAAFEFEAPETDVAVAGLLEPVFANVIENAAAHNDGDAPTVSVAVRTDGDRAVVEVADNGPGIGPHELEVLEAGTETALKHGSGLGLWIVKWGTDIAGGDVRFEANDPTGTVVTVEVPVLDREETRPSPPEPTRG
jgi:signal transduction histidine kinase